MGTAIRHIYTVNEWGARTVDPRPFSVAGAAGIVLHHSGTPVDPAAPPWRRAQQIQAGAMDEKGWADAGHNFLVTARGHVLEGRTGSRFWAERGQVVAGQHAGSVEKNSVLWGVLCEGNFQSEAPGPRQWRALVELCAWLCEAAALDPRQIQGHSQIAPTECPGRALRQRVPLLRETVRLLLAEREAARWLIQ